jgi:hypothetical protein
MSACSKLGGNPVGSRKKIGERIIHLSGERVAVPQSSSEDELHMNIGQGLPDW